MTGGNELRRWGPEGNQKTIRASVFAERLLDRVLKVKKKTFLDGLQRFMDEFKIRKVYINTQYDLLKLELIL